MTKTKTKTKAETEKVCSTCEFDRLPGNEFPCCACGDGIRWTANKPQSTVYYRVLKYEGNKDWVERSLGSVCTPFSCPNGTITDVTNPEGQQRAFWKRPERRSGQSDRRKNNGRRCGCRSGSRNDKAGFTGRRNVVARQRRQNER